MKAKEIKELYNFLFLYTIGKELKHKPAQLILKFNLERIGSEKRESIGGVFFGTPDKGINTFIPFNKKVVRLDNVFLRIETPIGEYFEIDGVNFEKELSMKDAFIIAIERKGGVAGAQNESIIVEMYNSEYEVSEIGGNYTVKNTETGKSLDPKGAKTKGIINAYKQAIEG